jgi:hypothetical protein
VQNDLKRIQGQNQGQFVLDKVKEIKNCLAFSPPQVILTHLRRCLVFNQQRMQHQQNKKCCLKI